MNSLLKMARGHAAVIGLCALALLLQFANSSNAGPNLLLRGGGFARARALPTRISREQNTALGQHRDSVLRMRGGHATLPLVDTQGATANGGKAKLKISINYGVEGGSIVVVGPGSSFGNGDINRGAYHSRFGEICP